jgi:sugar lactone lactonase YvrE
VAALDLPTSVPTFVNDVVVTPDAAWFTDSFAPVLYRVPLASSGVPAGPAQAVPLTGDWSQVSGFNANGIAATPSGQHLLVINSALGQLHRVDPGTGVTALVQTSDLTSGDGILLSGRELVVVRNFLNQVEIHQLSPDLSSATLVDTLTNPAFDVPTTVAAFGAELYVVNARFGTPAGPDVEYDIVKVG